jgi:hypothetical protein
MKQILMLIGQNLLRQIASPAGSDGAPGLLEPIRGYVEDSIKDYAAVTGVAFIFSLYFVAGTLIMITAAAESFDAFGFFAAGNFFYSGVAITVISLAALGGCYAYLKRGRKYAHEHRQQHEAQLPEVLPAPEAAPTVNFALLAEAVVTGIISGLISRRIARREPDTLRDRIRRVI